MQGKCIMKNVFYKCIASTPTKLQQNYIDISKMNGKSSIRVTQNHSETSVIKMKHNSVVTFGKLRRLDKYQH